ncbi:homoserine kinase [Paraburkholderia guartelaensis]|uniref:Hydroxylysine kinase n=1 Tax=Paraburkholderia guartelaensis TaxID=2546446 RepID=A0A4R5L4W2_9BURK|nr:phosphotransferase [Paraburkholderia guartelaensis]TDG03556.1 homoserine kinase [Paraburkholderia guartelaensis]
MTAAQKEHRHPEDDELFANRFTWLSVADASRIASEVYGIKGLASTLTSERDQNFRIEDASGHTYVLKVTNPAEDPQVTDFHTKAQLHLMARDPLLPIPHLLPTREGEATYWHKDDQHCRRAVRLITFLPGIPMHRAGRSPKLRASLGAVLARFDLALEGFDHPASQHDLLWDSQRANRLGSLLTMIDSVEERALAERFMQRFVEQTEPALLGLRRQVIHNDMNAYNIMVDSEVGDRVTAVLDFGDMVKAPLVNDIAVACAYQLDDSAEPLSTASECVAGYHAVSPLSPEEIVLLPELIAARLLVTVLITGWRAKRYPENRNYILRNNPLSWDGLRRLAAADDDEMKDLLLKACDSATKDIA